MKHIATLLLFLLFIDAAYSQEHSSNLDLIPVESEFCHKLGNKKIQLFMSRYGDNKDIVMINLHDNERTSVEAAKQVLSKTGGTLIRIENNNQRLVDFTYKKTKYQFDPNRIFTEKGTIATLNRYSKADAAAVKMVAQLGTFIFSKIPESSLLIALHNNTDSNYSTLSYLPGGEEAAEAAMVHYNPEMDIDDFFFTTSESLFIFFKDRNVNIILQNNEKATDDGSLSVLYALKNKPYINVEAEHGHVKEQETMIRMLIEHWNWSTK